MLGACCRASRNGIHQHGMLRAAEVSQQLCRKLKRLGFNTNSSCEGDIDLVLKAVTAGLFMSAAQYDRTEYDPKSANDMGSNVYRLLRHLQPGETCQACGGDTPTCLWPELFLQVCCCACMIAAESSVTCACQLQASGYKQLCAHGCPNNRQ